MRVNKDLVQISLKQSNINPLVVQSLTTWQANGFIQWWYKQVTTEHCQATQSLHSLSITELIAYSITSIALALYIDNQICDRRPVDLYILEFILISNS